MPTLTQVRQRILTRYGLGILIENANIDAIGSDYIQSARFFDEELGTNQYRNINAIIYRSAANTAADKFRWAGDYRPDESRLYIQGTNYTDTTSTSEDIEVWFFGLEPDTDVLQAIQRAQEWLGARTLLPLTLVPNAGGFSATTGWTPSDATLAVKGAVMQGRGSLEVTNTDVDGVGYSTAFGVSPNARLHAWAIGLGDNGTNRVVYEDVTNANAQVGDEQTFTARRPNVAYQTFTVPDGCYQMRVGLGGEENNAVTRWDMVFVNQEGDGRLFLPSPIQEAWEFEALCYMRFARHLESGIYDAMSAEVLEVPQADYDVSDLPVDTTTPVVQLHDRSWLRYPLVIQAGLKDSSIDLLTLEADTTVQPVGMLAARATLELVEAWGQKIPASDTIYNQALRELNAMVAKRGANGPAKRSKGFRYPFTR